MKKNVRMTLTVNRFVDSWGMIAVTLIFSVGFAGIAYIETMNSSGEWLDSIFMLVAYAFVVLGWIMFVCKEKLNHETGEIYEDGILVFNEMLFVKIEDIFEVKQYFVSVIRHTGSLGRTKTPEASLRISTKKAYVLNKSQFESRNFLNLDTQIIPQSDIVIPISANYQTWVEIEHHLELGFNKLDPKYRRRAKLRFIKNFVFIVCYLVFLVAFIWLLVLIPK